MGDRRGEYNAQQPVHPAQFIVRRNSYPQLEGFPEASAELTEKLIKLKPKNFLQAYVF